MNYAGETATEFLCEKSSENLFFPLCHDIRVYYIVLYYIKEYEYYFCSHLISARIAMRFVSAFNGSLAF